MVPVTLEIQILWTKVGLLSNPQAQILGARYLYQCQPLKVWNLNLLPVTEVIEWDSHCLKTKESNDLDITESSLAMIWLQRPEFVFNSSIEKGGFMVLPVLSSVNCTAGKRAFFPIPNRVLPLKDSNFKLLIMLDIKL